MKGHGWIQKRRFRAQGARGADDKGNVLASDFYVEGLLAAGNELHESDPRAIRWPECCSATRRAHGAFNTAGQCVQFRKQRLAWETSPMLPGPSPLRTSHSAILFGTAEHLRQRILHGRMAFAAGADPVEFRLRYLHRAA